MTTTRRQLRVWLVALWVASLVASSPSLVAQQVKETTQGKQFPTKYETGSENIKKGLQLRVTVAKDNVVCEDTKGTAVLTIPTRSVFEINYNTKARRRVAEGAVIAGALSLGIGAVIAVAVKTKKHFVNIIWDEGTVKKEAIFKVGKGEYASFIAELERMTGKEHRNLEMENKRIQEQLKLEKNKKMPVTLDRAVKVGGVDLKPGLYQVIFLPGKENKGDLYFFAGKEVNTKKIAAVADVEVAQVTGAAAASVTYKDGAGGAAITEIRSSGKRYRFL